MDENQKQSLAAKKHEIKLRIKVDEFIQMRLINWLEIYEIFLANNITHELVYLADVEKEEVRFWEKALVNEPLKKFNFDIEKINTHEENNVFFKLFDKFPSTYQMRYMPTDVVPASVSEVAAENITTFTNQLNVSLNEEVYLLYLYYAPVLKVKLRDIVAHAEQLYDFPMDDIVIVAPNLGWIIFRSMEDEWRFCRSTTAVS